MTHTITIKWGTPGAKSELVVDAAPLSGSDKQVEWAEDIRAKQLGCSTLYLSKLGSRVGTDADTISPLVRKLALRTEAKFWIDNRGASIQDLLKGER
jgi:hypothetical protein